VLCETSFGQELISEASPVLWYGRPRPNQWLTIGTNPSRGEFLHRDGTPRTGQAQKFYWRDALSFEDYLRNEEALQETIERASAYFESGRATTSWFGKPGGAKLEALLNGMGRSFYDASTSVIHVDFFKYATYEQMGKMKTGRYWMEHPTSIELLERTITTIDPTRLIVLGRENCRSFTGFSTTGRLAAYPAITYEIGRHESGIPMIGLHMKPNKGRVHMRINKFISESGKASRRQADRLVEEGRVTINGKKAKIGDQVKPGDEVLVNGSVARVARNNVYIAVHKPVGITSTTEKKVKGNLVDMVNHPLRIFNIGRLDKDSEGLILMTNDGDIVNEILRAEGEHEKEYIVSVDKPITPEFVEQMEAGVKILGQKTLPCKVRPLSKFDFNITLTQGLNRQIRRMCEALGYEVFRLQRVRVMNITLGKLPPGQWRDLSKKEREQLFRELNYEPKEWY
jgi:23S rRNA pseudouridine2604 synthase